MPDFFTGYTTGQSQGDRARAEDLDRMKLHIGIASEQMRIQRGRELAPLAQAGDVGAQAELAALGLMQAPASPDQIARQKEDAARYAEGMGFERQKYAEGKQERGEIRGEDKRRWELGFGREGEQIEQGKQERQADREERAGRYAQDDMWKSIELGAKVDQINDAVKRRDMEDQAKAKAAESIVDGLIGPSPLDDDAIRNRHIRGQATPEEVIAIQEFQERRRKAIENVNAALGINASPGAAAQVALPREVEAREVENYKSRAKTAAQIEEEAEARATGTLNAKQAAFKSMVIARANGGDATAKKIIEMHPEWKVSP